MKNNLTDSIYKAWRARASCPRHGAAPADRMRNGFGHGPAAERGFQQIHADGDAGSPRCGSIPPANGRSVCRKREWASINRLNGSGKHPVLFKYGANYGVPRTVDIIFTRGGLEQAVRMTQEAKTPSCRSRRAASRFSAIPWDLRIRLDNKPREDYKQIRDTIVCW